MQIKFYYNQSDDRQINKTLVDGVTLEGEIRGDVGIMTPVIRFQSDDVLRYNYCYIPDFHRYYSVKSVSVYREKLYDVEMEVDVLMSFRGGIVQLPCVVDKQTEAGNGDEYIDDSSLVTDNMMFSTVHNFPSGFLSTPKYILITAG